MTQKKTDLAGTKSVGEEIYFQVNYIMRNGGIKMNFATFPGEKFDNWKMRLPEEEQPIMADWRGNDVFEGDLIYLIGSDVVLKEDIENYIESEFGPATEV